jgi:hypothetical protein
MKVTVGLNRFCVGDGSCTPQHCLRHRTSERAQGRLRSTIGAIRALPDQLAAAKGSYGEWIRFAQFRIGDGRLHKAHRREIYYLKIGHEPRQARLVLNSGERS